MSYQYDHLMGTEQDASSHPANSQNYKMAGEVVNFPISMQQSDMNRMTAPRMSGEKPIPGMERYGTGITTNPKDNVVKLPGVD